MLNFRILILSSPGNCLSTKKLRPMQSGVLYTRINFHWNRTCRSVEFPRNITHKYFLDPLYVPTSTSTKNSLLASLANVYIRCSSARQLQRTQPIGREQSHRSNELSRFTVALYRSKCIAALTKACSRLINTVSRARNGVEKNRRAICTAVSRLFATASRYVFKGLTH